MPRHVAVQRGDGVVLIGQSNCQHRHRKSLLAIGDIFAPEGKESFFIKLQPCAAISLNAFYAALHRLDHTFGRLDPVKYHAKIAVVMKLACGLCFDHFSCNAAIRRQ